MPDGHFATPTSSIALWSTAGARREDDVVRLRVGAFAEPMDVGIGSRSPAARACADAWSETTARASVLVRTLRRSAHDVRAATQEVAHALRSLVASIAGAILPRRTCAASPEARPVAPKRRRPVPYEPAFTR